MRLSTHNIVSEIPDTDRYVIANLLSGHADVITSKELQALQQSGDQPLPQFVEKGYVVDPEEEQQRYRMAYLDYLEERDREELQLFFVPTYQCNFHCSYCYQAPYLSEPDHLLPPVIDAFFNFVAGQYGNRKRYVTLFGGEPLLSGKVFREGIGRFVESCAANRLDLAVVTNGYHLDEYLDMFSAVNIREIQLTLDGTEEVHNRRRPHKGGKKSFARIVDAIDECLNAGMQVNLRMVLDKENMDNLPELARFAIKKGWTASPLFKTQLGRNYELHHCHSGPSTLYSRLSMYRDLYHLIKKHPEILEFHRPAFSVARFLKENGSLPPPLFDACPACKGEWAFDYKGNIYSCTATVGKPGEELGSFYPEVTLKQERIETWQQRDVFAIDDCRTCNLQLVCGGGCGAVAKNREGHILATDCRPVSELLGMGVATYFSP